MSEPINMSEALLAGGDAPTTPVHPDVPAAFINTLREEGTKEEACDWVQKLWNEVADLAGKMKDLEEKAARSFNRGYVLACCNLQNLHGEPGIAFDVLTQLGVSEKEAKDDLAEYDLEALLEIETARGPDLSVYLEATLAEF